MGRSAGKDLRRANTGSGELQHDAVYLLCAQDAACWACIACPGVLICEWEGKTPHSNGLLIRRRHVLRRNLANQL
ncbi:hypothetical protein V5799_000019 [Amblyomma americanum]|uniref:Uncharacterized protein n=1 Tax=Amblyomma americanum TaxID=6943 RepID=A0AAQ4D489_AMBAM